MFHTLFLFLRMDHYKLKRFNKSFNISSADVLRLGGITFVTLNSMAMENDGCSICHEAVNRIKKIAGFEYLHGY